ncbi:hypothetical protein SUGI_0249180 [Cryptomeria japonica]|nr:hypothetical protein SUGI_0249180 [Cryptomeria japonica]
MSGKRSRFRARVQTGLCIAEEDGEGVDEDDGWLCYRFLNARFLLVATGSIGGGASFSPGGAILPPLHRDGGLEPRGSISPFMAFSQCALGGGSYDGIRVWDVDGDVDKDRGIDPDGLRSIIGCSMLCPLFLRVDPFIGKAWLWENLFFAVHPLSPLCGYGFIYTLIPRPFSMDGVSIGDDVSCHSSAHVVGVFVALRDVPVSVACRGGCSVAAFPWAVIPLGPVVSSGRWSSFVAGVCFSAGCWKGAFMGLGEGLFWMCCARVGSVSALLLVGCGEVFGI